MGSEGAGRRSAQHFLSLAAASTTADSMVVVREVEPPHPPPPPPPCFKVECLTDLDAKCAVWAAGLCTSSDTETA